MAATSALSDRIKILRNATWPDINIAPQPILSCNNTNAVNPDVSDYGCNGGYAYGAYGYIKERGGIVDETCAIYQARGWYNGLNCTDTLECMTCAGDCTIPPAYWKYEGLTDFRYHNSSSYATGEEMIATMINELQDGPIACSINAAIDEFLALNSTNGGDQIWAQNSTTDFNDLDHSISIVGYGTDLISAVNYWLVRNSWGTYWGDGGFVRVQRGGNFLGIELSCTVADASTKQMLIKQDSHNLAHVSVVDMHEGCRVQKTTFGG
jgi:cathepsin X